MRRDLDFHIRGVVIIVVLVASTFCSSSQSQSIQSSGELLDGFVREYANTTLVQPRTGIVYNLSLPSNFSGIEVSAVRFRSSTLWTRGLNFSYFQIPRRIIPAPYVKRIVIIFQNLNNVSSRYYQVPGHRLIAPVVGFTVYNGLDSSLVGNQRLNLSFTAGEPVSIRFPSNAVESTNETIKCVSFDGDSVQMSNTTLPLLCESRSQGHFSLAVVVTHSAPQKKKKEVMLWKWWVIGFVGGFVVLVLLGLVLVLMYKIVRRKKIKKMEKTSEGGVSIGTVWIGGAKMPSASMIRTQPASLENEHIP